MNIVFEKKKKKWILYLKSAPKNCLKNNPKNHVSKKCAGLHYLTWEIQKFLHIIEWHHLAGKNLRYNYIKV